MSAKVRSVLIVVVAIAAIALTMTLPLPNPDVSRPVVLLFVLAFSMYELARTIWRASHAAEAQARAREAAFAATVISGARPAPGPTRTVALPDLSVATVPAVANVHIDAQEQQVQAHRPRAGGEIEAVAHDLRTASTAALAALDAGSEKVAVDGLLRAAHDAAERLRAVRA